MATSGSSAISSGTDKSIVGKAGNLGARNHGGNGASARRGDDEIVAVESVPAYGEEKFAGADGARVNGVAGGHVRACVGEAGGCFKHGAGANCGFCQRELHRSLP